MKYEIEKIFMVAEAMADYLTNYDDSPEWESLAYCCTNEYGSDWAVFDEFYR